MEQKVIIKKGMELYTRGKRYKVLDTNTFGGKYRYVVQDLKTGRVTLMDREVAVASKNMQKERMEHGLPALPARRKRRTKAQMDAAVEPPSIRLIEGPKQNA